MESSFAAGFGASIASFGPWHNSLPATLESLYRIAQIQEDDAVLPAVM
jgi:hypothetical protein